MMKIFVQWEEDPNNIMNDIAGTVVVGTYDDADLQEINRWMNISPTQVRYQGPQTFLFTRHQNSQGKWPDKLTLEHTYSYPCENFMLPSNPQSLLSLTDFDFGTFTPLLLGLHEYDEGTFCLLGLHTELNSTSVASSSSSPAPEAAASGCKHQRGMTPINGHGICKKCGIDLD